MALTIPVTFALPRGVIKGRARWASPRSMIVASWSLPKFLDARGNLTFVEGSRHIPFHLRRLFYLKDVPTGADRGAHARRVKDKFQTPLSGSFDVTMNDGSRQSRIHLNRPWKGLHVPPMICSAEVNIDPSSVSLLLASETFDESDFIHEYAKFNAHRAPTTGPSGCRLGASFQDPPPQPRGNRSNMLHITFRKFIT